MTWVTDNAMIAAYAHPMTPKGQAVDVSPGSPQVILLATDFCAPARCALASAREIARLRGASVRALHVMDLTSTSPGKRPSYSVLHDSAESRLREIRRELRLAGVPESATLVAAGRPAQAIRQAAAQYQAALLILGVNGSRSRKTSTLGATARALLSHAPCPILTVAAPSTDHAPDAARALGRPLFVVDSAPESLRAVVAAWPANSGPPLTRTVLPPGDSHRSVRRLATAKAGAGSLEFSGAVQSLLREAAETHAGIIVLGLRGGGYLDSFSTGSFAHTLVIGARCPVLTVRC